METKDPVIITKSLVNDYDNFISKLSSDEPNSDALNAKHQSPKLALSFANIVQSKSNKQVVKISELRNSEKVDGAAVAIPIEAFEEFETKEGIESVMEHGPWLIRLVPLMLNAWTQNTNLKKEDIKHAPIWVKLHHVPIVAYSEVRLRRNTYARAMIEVAEEELKESITIAILMGNGQGHSLASVDIEYEWTLPMCSLARYLIISLDPNGEEAEQPQVTKNDADLVVNVSDSEVDKEIVLDDRKRKSVTKTNLKGQELLVEVYNV
nr:hypothetical protein [Tanacetum cinerariifolium]